MVTQGGTCSILFGSCCCQTEPEDLDLVRLQQRLPGCPMLTTSRCQRLLSSFGSGYLKSSETSPNLADSAGERSSYV